MKFYTKSKLEMKQLLLTKFLFIEVNSKKENIITPMGYSDIELKYDEFEYMRGFINTLPLEELEIPGKIYTQIILLDGEVSTLYRFFQTDSFMSLITNKLIEFNKKHAK